MAELPRIDDIIEQCGLEGEDAELFQQIALNRLVAFSNAAWQEDIMPGSYSETEFWRIEDEYEDLLDRSSPNVLKALETYLRAFLPKDVLARIDEAGQTD